MTILAMVRRTRLRVGDDVRRLRLALVSAALAAMLGAFALGPAGSPAAAREGAQDGPARTPAEPADVDDDEPLDAHQQRLRRLQDTIEASKSERRRILADLETIRNDRARLNAALLETASRIQGAETGIAALGEQLERSKARESALRESLYARREVLAEILAALQRMGRRPPPALLISPGDILRAVRTSMLLGAVVPELRAEAQVLTADLEELMQVRQTISGERARLSAQIGDLEQERIRLAALIDARQQAIRTVEGALTRERGRAAELAARATTLKSLIEGLESEIAAARRAAEAAREAAEAHRKLSAQGPEKGRNPFANRARLRPAIAFADARGLLPLPVSGRVRRSFGEADGFGGQENGMSIVTAPNALVSSPVDGWVVYAGPYRSYGQLLIVNAGDGYYIVLTGLGRLAVDVGQFVLAGEPVGSMGDGSAQTAAAIAIGASEPVLYIEFRKSGAAIDPGPWWSAQELEKVRG